MVKPCKQVWKAACVSCQEGILSAGAPQRRCSKPSDLPCKVSGKWKNRTVYTFEIGTYTSLQLFTYLHHGINQGFWNSFDQVSDSIMLHRTWLHNTPKLNGIWMVWISENRVSNSEDQESTSPNWIQINLHHVWLWTGTTSTSSWRLRISLRHHWEDKVLISWIQAWRWARWLRTQARKMQGRCLKAAAKLTEKWYNQLCHAISRYLIFYDFLVWRYCATYGLHSSWHHAWCTWYALWTSNGLVASHAWRGTDAAGHAWYDTSHALHVLHGAIRADGPGHAHGNGHAGTGHAGNGHAWYGHGSHADGKHTASRTPSRTPSSTRFANERQPRPIALALKILWSHPWVFFNVFSISTFSLLSKLSTEAECLAGWAAVAAALGQLAPAPAPAPAAPAAPPAGTDAALQAALTSLGLGNINLGALNLGNLDLSSLSSIPGLESLASIPGLESLFGPPGAPAGVAGVASVAPGIVPSRSRGKGKAKGKSFGKGKPLTQDSPGLMGTQEIHGDYWRLESVSDT